MNSKPYTPSLPYLSNINKYFILHKKNITSYVFITYQKSYILHRKIIHLTSSSIIDNIKLENLTSHIYIMQSHVLHWKILHLIFLSQIKYLAPEKYYFSYQKNITYHIYIKTLHITLENITSYIFITLKSYILHRKILHIIYSSSYILHRKNLISHIFATHQNNTSCIKNITSDYFITHQKYYNGK